jgi:hypothetical protein
LVGAGGQEQGRQDAERESRARRKNEVHQVLQWMKGRVAGLPDDYCSMHGRMDVTRVVGGVRRGERLLKGDVTGNIESAQMSDHPPMGRV